MAVFASLGSSRFVLSSGSIVFGVVTAIVIVLDTLPIVALTVIVLAVSLSATVKSPSSLIVVPDFLVEVIVHLIWSLLVALLGIVQCRPFQRLMRRKA